MDIKKFCYRVLRGLVMFTYGILHPFRAIGRENIPDGAAVVCANHTSASDPLFMAFAIPSKHHLCLMAKKELFKNKIMAFLFRAIGTFPVDRGALDVDAMKNAMACLKSGKKLGIFPEGTRTKEDGAVSPKGGAVRLAEKIGVPILPMYIPRKKLKFRRTTIVIGKPFYVGLEHGKLSKADIERIADELMDKIFELGQNTVSTAGN